MKKVIGTYYQWVLGGLLTLLLTVTMISQADLSLAHPPEQEGTQPDFTITVLSAQDGSASIQSQEAHLDHRYFAANGVGDGLEITPAGLMLAQGQAGGTYVSGIINSPLAFTTDIIPLWAVDLPDGTELQLETRLSQDGQNWSDWVANPEAFYPVRNDEHGGSIIWVSADTAALQFRVTLRSDGSGVSPTLKSLSLAFNDTSDGPTDGEIATQMADQVQNATANTCPVRPTIVSRTKWGCPDGQYSPRRPPTYQPVTHIIIHQAETPNSTAPYDNWAGWVRSVWNYHANVLWWGDVGYNYLIDPNGVIYEGRAGGDNVVGIHDGINHGSMAIGFLGCYGDCDDPYLSEADPSEAMLESAAQLMAWKLGQQNIDPLSSSPYGKFSDIPVIAGGRDVAWTSSPGSRIYDQLPQLRDKAKDKLNLCTPSMTCRVDDIIFDKTAYNVGDPINLTVKLVDQNNNPLGGADVTFDVAVTPTTQSIANTAAFDLIDLTGSYEGVFSDTTVAGDYLFTVMAHDPDDKFSCSGQASVPVKGPQCQITAQADPMSLAPGDPVDLLAHVTFNNDPVTDADVVAEVTKPDNTIISVPLPSTGDGDYSQAFTDTTGLGEYTFSVTANGEGFDQCQTPEDGSFSVKTISGTTTVFVEPPSTQLCEGSSTPSTTQIKIADVTDMQGFSFKLDYDPDIVSVVDADPDTEDIIEIRAGDEFSGSDFFVARNEAKDGVVEFAGTFQGMKNFSGDTVLAEIDWKPVSTGQADLILSEVKLSDPNAVAIERELINGSVEVTSCAGTAVLGQVHLQGRQNYGGVVVSDGQTYQTQTKADGSFSMASTDYITVNSPGYLSAQADIQRQLSQVSDSGPINLGSITLLAGDINDDDVIDILDISYLGGRYNSTDSLADLNADGLVDIFDLAVAAGNYGQQGPLTNWR